MVRGSAWRAFSLARHFLANQEFMVFSGSPNCHEQSIRRPSAGRASVAHSDAGNAAGQQPGHRGRSFISLIMLAFILRLAVPKEDSSVQLGVLLVAIGFAQIWLIFNFLKSFRK